MKHNRKRIDRRSKITRGLTSLALRIFPTQLRYRYFRSKIKVPAELNSKLTFKLAETKEELEGAFRILHDAYVDEGFSKPHPTGMRITKYHALPSTSILIVKYEDTVVGTISVLRHTPIGLPIQAIYDLSNVPTALNRTAEISSLAIDRRYRGIRGELLFPLIKYLFRYTIRYMRLDTIAITVHPKWGDFYEGLLMFSRLNQSVIEKYDFANGNPAVGYCLSLEQAPHLFSKAYYGLKPEQDLFHYMLNMNVENPSNFIFPDRRYYQINDPVMTPELLQYFFVEKQNILSEMTEQELLVLKGMYHFDAYKHIFSSSAVKVANIHDREPRIQVDCPAQFVVDGSQHSMRIVDVSSQGLLAKISVQVSAPIDVKIQVGDFEVAHMSLQPRWQDQNGQIGFAVLAADNAWCRFIYHLTSKYESQRIETFIGKMRLKIAG